MNDTLQNTAEWFRKSTPTPSLKNISTQIGVHFEEVREMVIELTGTTPEAQVALHEAQVALKVLGDLMKTDPTAVTCLMENRLNLLDSLCDQIVTATGSGVFFGMNVPEALAEVNGSNWSKFVDGEPVRDPVSQKIMKGPSYYKPNLLPFLPQ